MPESKSGYLYLKLTAMLVSQRKRAALELQLMRVD